ncbi:MAG: UvrD-helicase domain-containing protein, partial [Pyrinomonadaceae bacterium]
MRDFESIGNLKTINSTKLHAKLSCERNLVITPTLEPAQAKAAHTLDRHVCVTAGPGAGKTSVLVERYLHLLREKNPSSIDQIVAITFTNRSANEMRERLRTSLDKLLATVSGPERDRWMRYKRTLDGAVITTIHGFCLRILREFPVEAELDPQFMLLDEHRAATLLTAAVEESLTEFLSHHDEPISRLTAGIGRPMLASALYETYLKIRGQGLSLEQVLRQTSASHSVDETYEELCNELDQLIDALLSARKSTSRAAEKRELALRQWPKVREIVRQPDVSLSDYCGAIAEFREVARPSAKGRIASLVKELDQLFWGESKEKCFGKLPQARFDLLAKEYAMELIHVLTNIDRRYDRAKRELSALDFDDLQLRALEILQRPEVLERAARRYRYFLVDEFQDTNSLQSALLDALVFKQHANLFIVGDTKQSVYGFRGADLDVFGRMTKVVLEHGGELVPLPLNFRSQPPLIHFFNYLFERFFQPGVALKDDELRELGYVAHEPGEPRRDAVDVPPLVEFLVDTILGDEDPKAKQTVRERDAKQIVARLIELTTENSAVDYRDVAVLFRAMTDVPVYEAEFRRAGLPFQTVLGKGLYEREEITDLIQLCRFLDNRTDELALAAVMRSPLCGISDNTLLALRLAPRIGVTLSGEVPQPRLRPRPLFRALAKQKEIDFIDDDERQALERAFELLILLIDRRNRFPIGDLLRFAVEQSGFASITSANFDGGQRLANIEKLFNLAQRFERSGAHLIRDFVRYVHDFETIGSRESEGQLDETSNTIKIMTIHQAKGLEYKIVVIPDLHRSKPVWDGYFLLDRQLGLTLKVPNGRSQMVAGKTFTRFNNRAQLRDSFESMRLLYVAATRAQDRLILSGATKDPARLNKGDESWLQNIWQALELGERHKSDLVQFGDNVHLKLTYNLIDQQRANLHSTSEPSSAVTLEVGESISTTFPLLQPLELQNDAVVQRFSVTQLVNYRRCARQYYFDRVLQVPSRDERAVWNNADAPEPPANLTATLKGAVIHRFCERYSRGVNADACLRDCLEEVVSVRQAQLVDRLIDIDPKTAVRELLPLVENYLASEVFTRVERTRNVETAISSTPGANAGLWSEVRFRLRRPLGILSGT